MNTNSWLLKGLSSCYCRFLSDCWGLERPFIRLLLFQLSSETIILLASKEPFNHKGLKLPFLWTYIHCGNRKVIKDYRNSVILGLVSAAVCYISRELAVRHHWSFERTGMRKKSPTCWQSVIWQSIGSLKWLWQNWKELYESELCCVETNGGGIAQR